MEELQLTTPVTESKTTNKFRVASLTLGLELEVQDAQGQDTVGAVLIDLKDNNNAPYHYRYTGPTAVTMIKQLNTANLTTKSLHKRVLEKLAADGVLPGTVVGVPDA